MELLSRCNIGTPAVFCSKVPLRILNTGESVSLMVMGFTLVVSVKPLRSRVVCCPISATSSETSMLLESLASLNGQSVFEVMLRMSDRCSGSDTVWMPYVSRSM